MANNRDLSKLADILTDGTSGQVLTANGVGNDPTWQTAASGSGDVVGPASATDNAVTRFDGTTGKLVQNSAVTIADSGVTTVTVTDAGTNTVLDGLQINRQSTGTPAVGIGVGLEFAAETALGNTEVGAVIEAVTTDVTAASEDFDLVFRTMAAGAAAAERMRVTSTGALSVGDAATTRTNLGLGTLATQSGTFSGTSSGTNTGDQSIFQNIAVAGQTTIAADTTTDTLTVAAGTGITLTTNATTDTLTITNASPDQTVSLTQGGTVTITGSYPSFTISGAATDLSYTASTRLLASSTGADVTLPLFSSTEAGLTPLSGGGTSNFLRADGTWAAPSASSGVTSFSAGTTGFTPATATTGAVTLAGTLAVANGGTGATDAGTARTNLGLGTMATTDWTSNTAVAAAGTTQGTATAITDMYVKVTSGTGGVIMPTTTAGRHYVVENQSGATINIYPPVGGIIEGNSVNIPLTQPDGAIVMYIAGTATNYERFRAASFNANNPLALGTATPGTSGFSARYDHVHPMPTPVQLANGTAWQVTYQNGSGTTVELPLGIQGDVLISNGASAAPSWGNAEYTQALNANRTLTSTTAAQAIFPAASDTLTLPVGTYEYECVLYVSGMSATSGNLSYRILGAGTAVISSALSQAVGFDGTIATAGAAGYSGWTGNNSPASLVTAATGLALTVFVNGIFRVGTAGTIIPSVALVTASASAVMNADTHIHVRRISDSSTYTTFGPWA